MKHLTLFVILYFRVIYPESAMIIDVIEISSFLCMKNVFL